MANNWINDGNAIPFVGAATNGKITIINNLIGIADRNSGDGEDNILHVEGHFELSKGNFALSAGDLYLIDVDGVNVNAGAAGVVAFGIVTRDALAAGEFVNVVCNKGVKQAVTA